MIGSEIGGRKNIYVRGGVSKIEMACGIMAGIFIGLLIVGFFLVEPVQVLDFPLKPNCHKLINFVACQINDSSK